MLDGTLKAIRGGECSWLLRPLELGCAKMQVQFDTLSLFVTQGSHLRLDQCLSDRAVFSVHVVSA